MEIRIVKRNLDLPFEQQELIDRQIRRAFDRFETQIDWVDVCLSDVIGPKGGLDTSCRLRIRLTGKGEIPVEGQAAAVEIVIADVIDRAAFALSRRLERIRGSYGASMSGQ